MVSCVSLSNNHIWKKKSYIYLAINELCGVVEEDVVEQH